MTRAKNPSSPSRLILPLGGLLLATALMICWLVLVPHSTVVEMSLRVKRFEFIAVPEPSSASAVDRSFKLFESPVKLRYLSLKGVEGVAATLEGQGRAELRPENDGWVRMDGTEPFSAEMSLRAPTRLVLLPAFVDGKRGGGHRLTVTLGDRVPPQEPQTPAGEEAASRAWSWMATIEPESQLSLRAKDVGLIRSNAQAPERVGQAEYVVPQGAAQIVITGGARECELNLTLEPKRKPGTELRVLDPATGQLSETRRLDNYVVRQPQAVEWNGSLVLLDPDPGETEPVQAFKKDLPVRDIKLWRGVGLEVESFVSGGRVRFLEGHREPLDVDPDVFLTVDLDAGQALALRSIRRVGESFEVALRGKVKRLKLGATAKLQNNVLPNQFEWLYTHKLAGLIYGTLAWVVGASLAFFKMIGLLGKQNG